MKIELGKAYKHPDIDMPYVAFEQGKDGLWMMISAGALVKYSLTGECPYISDYWKISDDYANNNDMREFDLKNLCLDENYYWDEGGQNYGDVKLKELP